MSESGSGETVAEKVGEAILDTLASNLTNGTNETDKFKPTTEGLCLAYTSLLIMALIPIIVGSWKSVSHHKTQKDSGEEIEIMSTREAMMFPVIASVTLFSIYIVFKLFHKDNINFLLACYFFILGSAALTRMSKVFVDKIWPHSLIKNEKYDIHFSWRNVTDAAKNINLFEVKHPFDRQIIVCFIASLFFGAWYFLKKHWIANNIFGLAFAVSGIEFLQLNKVLNGCILLGGLFLYDIFWVFGTDVMVSVAKSFDAPIKLIFPQDLIEHGIEADKFALLGLGDIVIPGIFIALLLRFDISLNRNSRTYFNASFAAYVIALVTCIVVMHVFKHAQPALLYIVPLCLIIPLFIALVKGDIKAMFAYCDHEEEEDNQLNDSATSSLNASKNTDQGDDSINSSKDEPKKSK